MPKTLLLSLAMLTTLVLLPDTAHAGYLDPGSGSTLVQGIIAALVGLKRFFTRILHPFSKNKG